MYKRIFLGILLGSVMALTACAGKKKSVDPAPTPPTARQSADHAFAKDKAALTAILPLYKGCICSLPSKALYELDKVLQNNPQNAYALGLKALALSQLDQYDKAFDAITTAILQTSSPFFYGWRGLILLRVNNTRGAARDVEYALSQNPHNAAALMVQGQLYLRAGQTDAGCASLQEACTLGECSGQEAALVGGQCTR